MIISVGATSVRPKNLRKRCSYWVSFIGCPVDICARLDALTVRAFEKSSVKTDVRAMAYDTILPQNLFRFLLFAKGFLSFAPVVPF